MKEISMAFGFGLGLITGALLYKYHMGAKKLVDNGEKAVMNEVKKMDEKAGQVIKQAEAKMKEKSN